ncbi:MAG TPA: nuclear transport factor 2 family protein [Gemmatimonadaceae bacterium]|jgi:uncharacterized protein (TIGR02246 family)|nr:nuclear transport factor 2 family protein [Gemmatimonadaceae bacterium]
MHQPIRSLPLVFATFVTALAACQPPSDASTAMTDSRRQSIADSLMTMVRAAYNLDAPDVMASLMSLYPDSGRVVSASGGRVTTTRDSLERGIRSFYEYVGRNMQDPTWNWGPAHVDVLSPDAAVVTTTYRVPHRTPAGAPHTIAGAITAVFARRDGKWVVVQEHLSEMPPEAPAADTAAAHPGHEP